MAFFFFEMRPHKGRGQKGGEGSHLPKYITVFTHAHINTLGILLNLLVSKLLGKSGGLKLNFR